MQLCNYFKENMSWDPTRSIHIVLGIWQFFSEHVLVPSYRPCLWTQLHPSCTTSNLQIQHSAAHLATGPSLVTSPYLLCCTLPNLQICPRSHIHCPNLVWLSLPTLSPASQLGPWCTSYRTIQPTMFTWFNPFYAISNFQANQATHLCYPQSSVFTVDQK